MNLVHRCWFVFLQIYSLNLCNRYFDSSLKLFTWVQPDTNPWIYLHHSPFQVLLFVFVWLFTSVCVTNSLIFGFGNGAIVPFPFVDCLFGQPIFVGKFHYGFAGFIELNNPSFELFRAIVWFYLPYYISLFKRYCVEFFVSTESLNSKHRVATIGSMVTFSLAAYILPSRVIKKRAFAFNIPCIDQLWNLHISIFLHENQFSVYTSFLSVYKSRFLYFCSFEDWKSVKIFRKR